MDITAIDPGKTSGICIFSTGNKEISLLEAGFYETVNWIDAGANQNIAIEEYLPRGSCRADQLDALYLNGFAVGLSKTLHSGRTQVFQYSPRHCKEFTGDTKLRELLSTNEEGITSPHIKDAIRVMRKYLKKQDVFLDEFDEALRTQANLLLKDE